MEDQHWAVEEAQEEAVAAVGQVHRRRPWEVEAEGQILHPYEAEEVDRLSLEEAVVVHRELAVVEEDRRYCRDSVAAVEALHGVWEEREQRNVCEGYPWAVAAAAQQQRELTNLVEVSGAPLRCHPVSGRNRR